MPRVLTDLPSQDQSEDVVRSKVLEAHKILMGLNDSNREAFHDLVNALERTDPVRPSLFSGYTHKRPVQPSGLSVHSRRTNSVAAAPSALS
jgi:hypothetical protein